MIVGVSKVLNPFPTFPIPQDTVPNTPTNPNILTEYLIILIINIFKCLFCSVAIFGINAVTML